MDVVYYEAGLICGYFKENGLGTLRVNFSQDYYLEISRSFFGVKHALSDSDFYISVDSEELRCGKHFLDKETFVLELISIVRSKYLSKKAGVVYKITNKLNNECYIGKTIKSATVRWKAHIDGKENSAISKAISEFGIDNFVFEVIEEVEVDFDYASDPDSALLKAESKWICFYNSIKNGYNARL